MRRRPARRRDRRLLGSPAADAAWLAVSYWRDLYPLMPDGYRSPECRAGGAMDERLAGAILGYLIFTVGLGIGDTDVFDFGGIVSAIIGTVIVLVVVGYLARRRGMARR